MPELASGVEGRWRHANLTIPAPLLAAVTLVSRFRGPVWNSVSNVLTYWYAPRTEVPGAVQALDRAEGPTVRLSYTDVREKRYTVGH